MTIDSPKTTGEIPFGKNNMNYKNIGEYKYFDKCRFCFSKNGKVVIDIGHVPLAGGFLKADSSENDFKNEKQYPLQLFFCKDCKMLQVNTSVNPDTLFKNYFYFTSSMTTLVEYFKKFSDELLNNAKYSEKTHIVEIGCNDGALLDAFIKKGVTVTGVDPATNVVKPLIKRGIPIINDYFGEKVATDIINQKGQADYIVSFHSMAHIENMHDVVKGIKKLLKPTGTLAFEVHYLGNLILEKQYDMIYHEHQYYYSLHSLQNFFAQYEMEVFDVQKTPMRGGSMIYYIQHKNSKSKKITQNVKDLILFEKKNKLINIETFQKYNKFIRSTKKKLLKLLDELLLQNKTIIGYGASGRGTIIMNYCGLDKKYFNQVIDDAPQKWDAYTPGTHQKIIDNSILSSSKNPDYCVLFAWPFTNEVVKRNEIFIKKGGKFITPLPHVKIIP